MVTWDSTLLQLLWLKCSSASNVSRQDAPVSTTAMNHVDVENKRVKDVTDAILFDLLPAAIARVTQEIDDVPQELTWDLCQVSMSRLKSKLLLTTAALDCCSQLLFTLVLA